MVKKYCLKLVKNEFIFLGIFLFVGFILQSSKVFAASVDTINIEGKIVRNDSGYEGMNISTGSPACVVSGSANDTCDFQVKYYSASTSGTLFLTETFSNKEIGQYNGAFNLSLGSGTVTAGTYASLDAVILAEDTVYLEIGFSPAGNASFTETFSRMPLQASAYAIRSKYSSEADTAFQFDTASNSSGYTTPTAGMVYFDTTDSELKLYDGSSWTDISGGAGVAPSLWTDAGDYSYLTSTTDHLVLGSTYIEIGVNNYATYLSGLASNSPFAFDMDGERLSVAGDKAQSGLTVYSNYTSTGAWPLVVFKSEYSGFDNTVLEVTQDGTGSIASFKKGSAEVFAFENEKTFFIGQRADAPVTYTDRLYNVGGTLYWSGSSVCTLATGCGVGGSLWTDGGTYTYLTSSTEDLIVGGNTPATSAFFFDVSTGRLGIGTSTPTASLDIAGASSSIANSSGDITISADDTLVVKANDTEADNLMEWQNSVGTVLGLINQSGYVTFGNSTGSSSAILALGANTTAVTQVNLASSAGVDVASPISGDLWWNGTNLYFYDGTESIDLLGAPEMVGLTNAYGSVSNGSYLNLQHDQNTYAVVADGWVCVGGSSNENCSGGNWKNIKDTDYTVKESLSNQWEDADPNGVIRSDVRLTDVELSPGIDVGTGADGSITVSSNTNINTLSLSSGRSCADGGDAVNYNITAFNAAGTEATLTSSPSTGCLNVGDEVLIINLQGTNTAYGNVGNYETLRISGVAGNKVTFQIAKTKYYGNNLNDDSNLGTLTSNQRVILQRVPNYYNVTVNTGVSFTPSAWNGVKGGVMFFRANGSVSVGGTISAYQKGYRNGGMTVGNNSYMASGGGEAFCSPGGAAGGAGTGGAGAGGGGGGPNTYIAGTAYCGGGGGGTSNLAGSATLGGAGGGASGHAGGGGGGYGTFGYAGPSNYGSNGGTSTSGAGGNSNTGRGGGGGGGTYGDANLNKLMFGSGGGSGGSYSDGAMGGRGGIGGGIISIAVNSLSVSGSINSNGEDGRSYMACNSTYPWWGGGGGGAGGSIKIATNTGVLGAGLVMANNGAGSGGCGNGSDTYYGGDGGVGRIAIYYASGLTGSTSPTYTGTFVGYNSYGVYNSPVISTPNTQSYENISWSEDLDTYGNIGVQTRSGGDSHPHLDYNHRDNIWIGSVFGLGNSNITFESWIRLNDNVDAASEIFNIGDSSTNGYGLALDGTSLKSLVVWYPGVRWTDTGVDLSSGWHHIALVINASGQPSVYIDGDMVYSDTGSAPVAPSSGESTTIGYGFGGYISDVRIWNTARTQSQIQDNRHNRLTGSESGLVGYWKLDEGQGTTVQDSTSNNNDGYLARDIWEDTYSWSWESWKPYNLSESTNTEDSHLHLDYNHRDFIWIGSAFGLGNSNVTIESWIRLNENVEAASESEIFIIGDGSSNGYALTLYGTSLKSLVVWYPGVRWTDTGVDLTSGWHHVALVINASGQPSVYVDGELVYSDTSSAPVAPSSGDSTTIGYGFGGYMSDFRIWNTARTEGQIKNNMYNRLIGSESGLVGYWKLDEGVGTTLQDSTTNNNDGYLNRDIWEDTVSWTANGTGHTLLESANTHTNWTGTNSTVAEGDVTRNVDFFEDEDETTAGNITKVTSSTNGGYAEATITASDLSNYDYLTLWVRASQIGNVLRIGIGESAATEQYEDITIDASNTWQKVYWDLSDIRSTSIDAVTKLRITNFSASSNTIYIDNISAEKLLTDYEGSKIQSTPNNYLQYRIIFTTTNLSYQPRLENISITYNTGYQIELYDNNNVRLYNYTGDTKYLKLSLVTSTVASGSVLGASTSSLMEFDEPSVLGVSTFTGDTEITGYFSNVLVNNTGQSNNLLKLQTNDTDMLVVNTLGDLSTKGDIAVNGGSISLGSNGNIRFNEETNTIEFSTDSGISWMSLGSQISKSYLFAEYAGAVFSADGSNNIGNMTADNTGTASNSMNYYEWNSSETSLNDYDVRVRFALPSNFESWGSGGITFNYSTESVDTASNEVDFYVFEETSLNIDGSAENNISPIAGEWSTATISGTTLDECNIANGICVLSIKLSSSNDNYVRIGDIEITYNRSI